ncbi:MAG: OmpH family outer membrane protein [Salibacteraceae bacterium]|nr:OmpH family outer membrane protein [Salibacteraceae bacterium]|tara:strand:+ start:112958 stop:113479 length:522 start_codon:yes stop_codon:yes gene_type:complete
MRNIYKTVLTGVLLVAFSFTSNAQKSLKFGHINSNDLLTIMPERDSAEAQLKIFAQELELQLTKMSAEYEKKYTDYQANVSVMNEVVRASKEEEILELQKRIQDFQQKAQQSLQKKETTLMEPLIAKAKKAITDVAKENNYSYVFDTSIGALIHYPEGDDVLPLVKTKLGLTQ